MAKVMTYPLDARVYKTQGSVRPKFESKLQDGKWLSTSEQKVDRATGLFIWLIGVIWQTPDSWGGQNVQNGWIEMPAAVQPVVKSGATGDTFSGFSLVTYESGGVTMRAAGIN